jgi:DNA-3-methyladenine glycosylase
MKPLPQSFFDQPTLRVANNLVGCTLVRRRRGKTVRSAITETEAYGGFHDRASHASRGKTKRNEIMFRSAGHIYVYFTYGMHWMLNIVTGKEGHPAAVLIRGVEGINGPARLTKRLNITGALNGKRLGRASGLWIEGRTHRIAHSSIERTPRIGVAYAGPTWAKKKWRFVLRIDAARPIASAPRGKGR